jgi:CRP-like cAMP-binding protein
MRYGALGKVYQDGESIVRQGETGNCMFVIQRGEAEVVIDSPEGPLVVAALSTGDVFGEMALFTKHPRSATVRSRGKSRILTVDKRAFMKRIHEDPSLAFHVLQKMAERIQHMNDQLAELRHHASADAK